MLYYLNRGLILEQAICSVIHDYFESLEFDNRYRNFHLSVTTQHPFAELYLHDSLRAEDSFPCVVVSTGEDRQPSELNGWVPECIEAVGINKGDLKEITDITETYTDKKGNEKTREKPGLCCVLSENAFEELDALIPIEGYIYGYSLRSMRKDVINLEIWAENIQLKNEIYEQLRLFLTGNFLKIMQEKYSFFSIDLFPASIVGHRSNNYNFDFDVSLSGAHISFECAYCIEQIVIDTEIKEFNRELILEVLNGYWKEENGRAFVKRTEDGFVEIPAN